jgi:hypothetical protein
MTLRLNRLVASFAGLWCPQRGENGHTIAGSQSKLYLTDPLLAWIPRLPRTGTAEPDMTQLSEMTIGVALARAMDRIEERAGSNRNGWNHGWRAEARTVEGSTTEESWPPKSILDREHPSFAIPAPLVARLLG